MIIIPQKVELLSVTPEADKLIEIAGRTCYLSEPKGDPEGFIKKIIKNGHLSVVEHASATFRFTTNRYTTHQMVRHRICNFSQQSNRYCAYKDGIKVVAPRELDIQYGEFLYDYFDEQKSCLTIAQKIWVKSILEAEKAYLEMLNNGIKPEVARSVLPECSYTTIVMTANFREWMHIFKERCSPRAQSDIRWLMEDARRQLLEISCCFRD